jgi:hypothetical protein
MNFRKLKFQQWTSIWSYRNPWNKLKSLGTVTVFASSPGRTREFRVSRFLRPQGKPWGTVERNCRLFCGSSNQQPIRYEFILVQIGGPSWDFFRGQSWPLPEQCCRNSKNPFSGLLVKNQGIQVSRHWKILWTSTFSNQFYGIVLLEHRRVIVPTSTIPNKTNNTNSRPRWWLWQKFSVVRKWDC